MYAVPCIGAGTAAQSLSGFGVPNPFCGDLFSNFMTIDNVTQQVKKITTASYEKQIYDLKQMLEISKSLSSVLEFKTLIESILYICMCQMRTLSAGIFIQNNFDAVNFTLDTNYNGMELSPDTEYAIPLQHPCIALLEHTNMTYTFEELCDILKEDRKGIEVIGTLSPSLVVPLKVKNRLNGVLVLGERIDLGEGNVYSMYEKEQILNIASLAAIAINNTQLIDMTTTDMMTHLKLKHYFFTVLMDKLERAAIDDKSVAILMLDIDHFKHFNDTYGHASGDMVLQEVANVIKNSVRSEDLAARYGGEEFVVMLFESNEEAAVMVAERIRNNIQALDLEYEGAHMKVTISIGVSVYSGAERIAAKKLVENADTALYESKKTGRNKTTAYRPSMKIQ